MTLAMLVKLMMAAVTMMLHIIGCTSPAALPGITISVVHGQASSPANGGPDDYVCGPVTRHGVVTRYAWIPIP